MSYEINVAFKGRHYFATHERSLLTYAEALSVYKHFRDLFPESRGYSLTLKELVNMSRSVDTSEIDAPTSIFTTENSNESIRNDDMGALL